jgi:uncharacterized membrane protein YhaH (DUF805 family)
LQEFNREGAMNFWQAIASGFSNYVTFSGRAARSEYWYWVLFAILGGIAAAIVDATTDGNFTEAIFNLATFLPSIALVVRRLHDTDRSGWWFFLIFIPLVGAVILIVWFCTIGTRGPNRFGADPLASSGAISPRPAV